MVRNTKVRRVRPENLTKDHLAHRDALRKDFWFACCYCSFTETESPYEFQVDHYLCQKGYGSHRDCYENWVWSCRDCNRAKSDLPDSAMLGKGARFARADFDEFDTHIKLNGARLDWLTPIGECTVRTLRLNSSYRRKIRTLRSRSALLDSEIVSGLRGLLACSIETIAKSERFRFTRELKACQDRAQLLYDHLYEEAEKSSRLEALDTLNDEDARKDRRRYLEGISAIGIPGSKKKVPQKAKSQRKQRRKRK